MNSPTRFAQADTKARFTLDEFVRICESGALGDDRLELVDGEIERMTPPMAIHSAYQGDVFAAFIGIARDRAVIEAGVDLGDRSLLACDVALLVAPMRERRYFRPEEILLAVEISDITLDRDLMMKRHRYAAALIRHYWVVDTHRSVVHVFGEPADGDYARFDLVPFGKPLPIPGADATIMLS